MARAAAKTVEPTPKKGANALIPWDEQMARDAETAAAMEANTGGGNFFSFKGGILSFNGAALPNNQMGVVVLDHIFENVFYEGEYDPTQVSPPTCFALGRDELTLAPHEVVVAHGSDQHGNCQGCPMNAWGTADKGRGKACRNTRRLAVIPAGELDEAGRFKPYTEEEHFEKAPIGYMKLPVTSVKGWATIVKQVAGALKRPPHGIFMKVRVVPDAQTQFKVNFEPISKAPDSIMPAIMARREEVMATIAFPYSMDRDETPAPAKGAAKGKAPAKNVRPEVKKAGAKRY